MRPTEGVTAAVTTSEPATPRRRTRVAATASILLAGGVLLAGCTSSSSSSGSDSSRSASSSGATASSSAPTLPTITDVSLADAKLVVRGDTASLTGTVRNATGATLTLRAFACGCAGMVQVGRPAAGSHSSTSPSPSPSLTPLKAGIPVKAKGSVELGGSTAQVHFSGLAKGVTKGSKQTVTVYFGAQGSFDTTVPVVD